MVHLIRAMKPKISVIVPIYNVGKFLDKCVSSLIIQTYDNLEIILVNDGSTDNSLAICRHFESIDSRVCVIDQQNKGLVGARKAGVIQSKGDYITYVDGDDWVEPCIYERFIDSVIDYGVDVVIAAHWEDLPNHSERLQNTIPAGYYQSDTLSESVYQRMLCTENFSQFGIFSYVWGKLYKRELLLHHQLKVDDGIHIGEDAACLYPLLLDANSVYISDEAFYHYRQRTDSLIKTRDPYEVMKLKRLYSFLSREFLASRCAQSLLNQLERFVVSLLIVRLDLKVNEELYGTTLIPFANIREGSKVAIYGAGTFGQHLVRQIQDSGTVDQVAWVDPLCSNYNKLGLKVEPPNSLQNKVYDYVLVAYVDELIANKVVMKLSAMAISSSKIVTINYGSDFNRRLLGLWCFDQVRLTLV